MQPRKWLWPFFLAVFITIQKTASALDVDVQNPESIKQTAKSVAHNMMAHYHGDEPGHIPGKIPGTWWEGSTLFMTLIQYWYWTGDPTYNKVTTQGLLWQKGDRNDFFPRNWSTFLGNDDQMFWGTVAMTAAELNFPELEQGQPSWLSLAQGVFNTQVPRWDKTVCGGGMRWQIWPYEAGYTTKNAISNGGLFQLVARLGRYTQNETYIQWAEKIWDWSARTPLLGGDWVIADTTSMENQCLDHGDQQWTYNYGAYLSGAAYMYNLTNGGAKWKTGIDGLLGTVWRTFFSDGGAMSEIWCEISESCDRNEDLFKGLLSSWLTFAVTIVPYTADAIIPRIQQSAIAAAGQCAYGRSCGRRWNLDDWDGSATMQSDISALSVLSSAMITFKYGAQPLTPQTGATSKSNPNAGSNEDIMPEQLRPITAGDRVGAAVVTLVFIAAWWKGFSWMVWEDKRDVYCRFVPCPMV